VLYFTSMPEGKNRC